MSSDPRAKGLPLRCAVEGDSLIFRVGVESLAFAAEQLAECWDAERDAPRVRIVDPLLFAQDVAAALNDEAEDGSSLLTELLDEAILAAVANGSEGAEETARPAGEEPSR